MARARIARGDKCPKRVDADLAAIEAALARALAAVERVEEAERILDALDAEASTRTGSTEHGALDGEGALLRAAAVARSVATLRRAEAAMLAARTAEEEANRHKAAFLATVSHELRTPLTAVVGYSAMLELTLAGHGLAEEAADAAQIARSSQQLIAIVNDLLDAAQLGAAKVPLNPAWIELGPLVADVVAQVSPLAAPGVVVSTEVRPGLGLVGDETRLRQVMINLVGNAVKFTGAGRVVVSARETHDGVEISVADTGIGIAPYELPHVFEAFHQAESSAWRRYGGTGLGLAIAKQLVDLHGGTIRAESRVGFGTTMTVVLPVPLSGAVALNAT